MKLGGGVADPQHRAFQKPPRVSKAPDANPRGGFPSQVGGGPKEQRLHLPSGCGQHLWGAGISWEVLTV